MISEHWKTQPRDERGRWTDEQGFFRTNTSCADILGKSFKDVINKKLSDRVYNIHNETEYGVFDFDDVEKDLQQTSIGKEVLNYIESENLLVEMNYDINASPGVLGSVCKKTLRFMPQIVVMWKKLQILWFTRCVT